MFGRSKPVVFEPHGRRRGGWRVPRWLLLLLTGTVAGAGGVLYLQERVLPPRLSPAESATLRGAFDQADGERRRLQAELAATKRQLDAAQAGQQAQAAELGSARALVQGLRADVASLVEALPPDPRDGNAVAVRAGRFSAAGNTLAYDLVLTRARGGARPLPGVLQISVAGEPAGNGPATVTAKPVALSIAGHEVVRGSIALPDGFRPRQTTVQVLDREAGRPLGMRVLLVGR
ncbi:MAG: hypothetical protein U1F53_12510 [Burkholderiaceae bacterium]